MPIPSQICAKCFTRKLIYEFHKHPKSKHGRHKHCKICAAKYQKDRLNDPRKRMQLSSMSNSRVRGTEHTIKWTDIPLPKFCKYLGIRLDYRRAGERGSLRSQDAPSIDRIDPSRGYVPGNVQVISDLANRMKQDATIKQLLAFAEGVIRVHGG